MKNLLYVFLVLFVIACDKDPEETSIEEISNGITVLDATGTLAEQTTEEAKKIIFGRWDFSFGAKPEITKNAMARSNSCEFDYIEFTDDNYILGFLIDGEPNAAFGTYALNEDANGYVTSVDLYFNNGESDIIIATLTDVVVIEENNEIKATFTIALNTSGSDYEICNNLEGSHTTQKEDPMEESDSSEANSNHALFVRTWVLVSVVENGVNITSEMYNEPCYSDDEYITDCEPATQLFLSVSTYGTYIFAYTGSSEGTFTETNSWRWSDDTQTAFYVGNDSDSMLITVESLSDTDAVFSEEGDQGTIYYTFSKL
jgi:hypothetical protein